METTVDSVTDSSSKIRVQKKLGMILENKVFQILKLEKNAFYKKLSQLIFLNDFF